MALAGSLDNIMEASGAQIHTGFPAKVLSVSGDTAKIQPLFYYAGAKQGALSGVPIPQSVRKAKVVEEKVVDTYDNGSKTYTTHYTKLVPPEPGDIVYCLCAEQTLGSSWQGQYTGRVGRLHHQLSDAVIIAIF